MCALASNKMLFNGGYHWAALPSLITLWWLCAEGEAQLVSAGFSVTFNDVYYYVSPYSVGNVSVDLTVLSTVSAVHGFYPVTVIQEDIGVSGIQRRIRPMPWHPFVTDRLAAPTQPARDLAQLGLSLSANCFG